MQTADTTELAKALSVATEAWQCWSTTETTVGVDFLLGRGAFAKAFGVFATVPYDLDSSPGCVLGYPKVSKAQSLAMSTGSKAIAIIQGADGLYWSDLLVPPAGTIERPREKEQWPAESHGGAPLVYRLLRSTLTPLRIAAGR